MRKLLTIAVLFFPNLAFSMTLPNALSDWHLFGPPPTLSGVSFTDPNNGIVVGTNGTILRTTDGGNNWTPQASGKLAELNARRSDT